MTKKTWLVTIGSSDIQLTTKILNLSTILNRVDKESRVNKESRVDCKEFKLQQNPQNSKRWLLPARVMGMIDLSLDKLDFPLWSSFLERTDIQPFDRVIVILTNQQNIFKADKRKKVNCPFWQDTITCKDLFKQYLAQHDLTKKAKIEFLTLEPEEGAKGIDDWSSMLDLVRDKLSAITLEQDEIIYVSHQASTPAISSAVQFVSLARFGDAVRFLVSNEYSADSTILLSSSYLEGLKRQQAKALIQEGHPGAALTIVKDLIDDQSLLDELNTYVDLFNLNGKTRSSDDFKPENAAKRIREALDLVEFFFTQENYIQGITLLAATHEAFLKSAIILRLSQLPVNLKAMEIIQWTKKGLGFTSNYQNNNSATLLPSLKFPKYKINSNFQYKWIGQNPNMLAWLKQLTNQKKFWPLLDDWIGFFDSNRDSDHDYRNQIMHNLRGVTAKEAVAYLAGRPKDMRDEDAQCNVVEAYRAMVKEPFLQALNTVGLWTNADEQKYKPLPERLKALAEQLDTKNPASAG